MLAPYLKRVWLDDSRVGDRSVYPFCLPIFKQEFSLEFDTRVTIVVGENGVGKSTVLEAVIEDPKSSSRHRLRISSSHNPMESVYAGGINRSA